MFGVPSNKQTRVAVTFAWRYFIDTNHLKDLTLLEPCTKTSGFFQSPEVGNSLKGGVTSERFPICVCVCIYIYIWVFPKIMGPPNHPFVHGVFHYFHHPFWGKNPPIFGNILDNDILGPPKTLQQFGQVVKHANLQWNSWILRIMLSKKYLLF